MKIFKYLLIVTLIGLIFTSCDEDNVDEPVNPNYKPTVTITTSNTTTSTVESDVLTIVYDVVIDKSVAQSINFTAQQIDGDASSNDYEVTMGTIDAFTNSTQVIIKIINDGEPELTETVKFKIVPQSSENSTAWAAEHNFNMVNPNSVFPTLDLTIEDTIPSDFYVQLGWDDTLATDLDVFVFDPNGNDYSVRGTGDNPERANMIAADAPDGDYIIGIDPYAVVNDTSNFDLNWSFTQPNGQVDFLTQDFDYTNRDTSYTTKIFVAWATNTYLMVKVTKTGNDFVITSL